MARPLRAAKSGSSGRSGSGGSSLAAQEAAAGLTPQLAAEGYTVVNGQIVRKLGVGGPNQYERADALVKAVAVLGDPSSRVSP